MLSPWSISLPLGTYKTLPVAIYSFNNGYWIRLALYPLEEAIDIHRKGLIRGREFLVFPANSAPTGLQFPIN